MNNLHVKTGDEVVVINGKYRGKRGKVMQVSPSEGKVIVEGRNIATKHLKGRKPGDPAGLVKAEAAMHACKVVCVCPKCGKPTRIAAKVYEDGKKDRMCAKCKEIF